MAIETLDNRGLRFPECVLKIAAKAAHMKPGDILEVLGDCPTFEQDLRIWCERLRKVIPFHKGRRGKSPADPDTVLEANIRPFN